MKEKMRMSEKVIVILNKKPLPDKKRGLLYRVCKALKEEVKCIFSKVAGKRRKSISEG